MNISTSLESNIRAIPLDWVVLKDTPQTRRHLLLPPSPQAKEERDETTTIDILLIVDCIYHPSLLPSLIETINYLTKPNQKTVVVVVSELRSEQVVREFLELWIDSGDAGDVGGSGRVRNEMRWKIYRCPLGMIVGPYVVWIGWKEEGNFG
jgi:hypothetical protein